MKKRLDRILGVWYIFACGGETPKNDEEKAKDSMIPGKLLEKGGDEIKRGLPV